MLEQCQNLLDPGSWRLIKLAKPAATQALRPKTKEGRRLGGQRQNLVRLETDLTLQRRGNCLAEVQRRVAENKEATAALWEG